MGNFSWRCVLRVDATVRLGAIDRRWPSALERRARLLSVDVMRSERHAGEFLGDNSRGEVGM
jgi:hypothetical protein